MSVARNLAEVHAKIEQACDSAGRRVADVTLIAVTKTVSIDLIRRAYDLGHRDFGESRLQEALPKIEALPSDVHWHFIGHLQSNKAKKIGQLFDSIHTLDSESQLKEIQKGGRAIEGFIEVNIANEPQKAGISPQSLDEFKETVIKWSQVHLTGLMTIGPLSDDPELSRGYFRELRNLAARIGVQKLSMGMSQDYDVAIQEGATHIRVGSAIFGSRP
jgi:PLP dependent protein